MHEYEDYFSTAWPPGRALLSDLRDEICTDAYGESEQVGAFACAFDDWGDLPAPVALPEGRATFLAVEDRDRTLAARIELPSRKRIAVPLEDVRPVAGSPAAFLVAAYRLGLGLEPLPEVLASTRQPGSPARRGQVRSRLLDMDQDELVDLPGDLYDAAPANRVAIHKRLGLPPSAPDGALLTESRAKIGHEVAPGPDDPIQLEAALELIEHYERQTADRRGTVDLLVHYLEAGNDAIRAYGALYEEYCDSMIGVAQRCVDALDAELTDEFLPRLRRVVAGAAGVGWGHEDMLFEIIGQLDWDEVE